VDKRFFSRCLSRCGLHELWGVSFLSLGFLLGSVVWYGFFRVRKGVGCMSLLVGGGCCVVGQLHVLHSCCSVEAGVDYRSLRGICSYPCVFRLMVLEIVICFLLV
jgi:hypothetical protein